MAKNLLKVAPKKRRVITPRGLDAKHFGEEPTWDDQAFLNEDELNSRLGKAYNWYNYFYEAKEGRRYLNDYMTEQGFSKAAQTMLNRTSDAKLNSTMCNTARMISMGLDAPQKLRDRLDGYLADLVEHGVEEAKKEKAAAAAVANLPEITHNPASQLIADIEDMLDNEASFDEFYKWLKGKNVKPAQAKAIADY